MKGKKFLKFTNNKMIILTVFLGAAIVGFTTGNVVAQEVKIGDTTGSPFISFEDAMSSGMYEIRLNDGTGEFQIWDMTNSRNAFIVGSNGNVGVGAGASTVQDFTIGCKTDLCTIQTRAMNGTASNEVKSTGGDKGIAKIRLVDTVTSTGTMVFEIKTNDDGTVCLGNPKGEPCMLRFNVNGPNPGQVRQANGSCIANC